MGSPTKSVSAATPAPTLAPTPVPTPAPTPAATSCQDDPDWSATNPEDKVGKKCNWIAKNPDERCKNKYKGTSGDSTTTVKAKDACLMACGQCDRRLGALV